MRVNKQHANTKQQTTTSSIKQKQQQTTNNKQQTTTSSNNNNNNNQNNSNNNDKPTSYFLHHLSSQPSFIGIESRSASAFKTRRAFWRSASVLAFKTLLSCAQGVKTTYQHHRQQQQKANNKNNSSKQHKLKQTPYNCNQTSLSFSDISSL